MSDYIFLNKGFKRGIFTAMPTNNHFLFPKEPFSDQFLKEPFFF